MHGRLLGVRLCTVRLLMVFHARSFHRVRRLLQCTLLECFRREQQDSWMFDRILDTSLVL